MILIFAYALELFALALVIWIVLMAFMLALSAGAQWLEWYFG